jgi:hypothetical protein
MNFSHNDLQGTIPPALSSFTVLQLLDGSDCGYTGTLPSQLALLTQLKTFALAGNRLSGTIVKVSRVSWRWQW